MTTYEFTVIDEVSAPRKSYELNSAFNAMTSHAIVKKKS